jgi:predicted transglutaminase-like cysteine proteinase
MDRIDELIPGIKEVPMGALPAPSAPAGVGHYLADYDDKEARQTYEEQQDSYMKRRSSSEALLHQRGNHPRVDAWNDFVDVLRLSPLSPRVKLESVNSWVNEAVNFSSYESKMSGGKSLAAWHQTPFQTLSLGSGMCDDAARLKYETLRAAGISDKSMRVVIGVQYDPQGNLMSHHAVLIANVDGENLVLNSTLTSAYGRNLPHGGIASTRAYFQGKAYEGYGRFVPLTVQNESDTSMHYPTYFDERKNYVLPVPRSPAEPELAGTSAAQMCTHNQITSCIDVVLPKGAQKRSMDGAQEVPALMPIMAKIQQAHELNPFWQQRELIPPRRADSRSVESLRKNTEPPPPAQTGVRSPSFNP